MSIRGKTKSLLDWFNSESSISSNISKPQESLLSKWLELERVKKYKDLSSTEIIPILEDLVEYIPDIPKKKISSYGD